MSQSLDEIFMTRARERGLLSATQVHALRVETSRRRRSEPDVGVHEIAVEKGWIGVEAALALLDAQPEDTIHDLEARMERLMPVHDVLLEPETAQFDDSPQNSDTARFEAAPSLDPSDDEPVVEVPRLVEPLRPSNAWADAPASDSHLEMELPPPAPASGDSIFDDSDSKQVPALDIDDAPAIVGERTPSARFAATLDSLDAELDPDEEEIIEVADAVSGSLEPEALSSADTLLDGQMQPDRKPTREVDRKAAFNRSDTETFGKRLHDTATDSAIGVPMHQPAPTFNMRGSKGATQDFASFEDPALEEINDLIHEESDEVSGYMADSAVGEVMDQADDSYFGPPADLSITPPELMEDSIAPPRPMDESTLFDSESLKADSEPEDFVATVPPGSPERESPSSVHDDSDIDVSVTLPGDFPADESAFADESDVSLVDITDESSDVSEVTTGSRTAFATGEVARPGLRNRTDSKLGVESSAGGSDVITGQEMTLADLRQQMGIGQGVKVGHDDAHSSTLGRLKKTSKKKRYSVVREIARGGMGKVIEVEDNDLRRSVALKVLRKEMLDRKDLVERFLEEAQITGQLEHPNIVPVHEIGVDGRGNLYFTMKLVEGEELSSTIKRLRKKDPSALQAYPISRLVDVFIKVCDGVSFAHSRGVIHRDLKPANIMVGRFGEVQIMDWGVSKIVGRKEDTVDREVRSDRRDDDAAQTMAGSILGTPSYMSPEQARGEVNTMGPESDIFSLGVILYELLALMTPWTAQTGAQVLDQVKTYEPESPSRRAPDRKIPPELDQLAMKCLIKAPHKRIGTAQELIDNLRSWQEGRTLAAVEYSIGQLIGKWIARHKVAVVTGLLVLGALIGGGIGVAQYLEQQNIDRAVNYTASAKATLDNAAAAFASDDFAKAEELARSAEGEVGRALALDPSSSEAESARTEAAVLIARSVGARQARLDAEQSARERETRMSELNEALVRARSALATARENEAKGTALAMIDEEFRQARAAYDTVRTFRVEGAEAEKTEALTAINEIDQWLRGNEERKQLEVALRELNELVERARAAFAIAQSTPEDKYREASQELVNTISICDRAVAVNVPRGGGERLRNEALDIKAAAALEFATRAIKGGHYDVADLMLNTGDGTGRLTAEIAAARVVLNAKVEEQSRFARLLADARASVSAREWLVAQSQIQAAMREAETSTFATDNDRHELKRMLELSRLEEIRQTDERATTSEEIDRAVTAYTALLEDLTDPDYIARAHAYLAEARSRLGSALYNEGVDATDDRIRLELWLRAAQYLTDRAQLADVRNKVAELQLRVALLDVAEDLVLLPRGNFVVGSNREGDNNPRLVVEMNKLVFIDKYLVTNEQFKEFVDADGYERPELWHENAVPLLSSFVDRTGQPGPATWDDGDFDPSLAKYPVRGVSWFEAEAYARWAGKRLPTAHEWEVAAGAPRSDEVTDPGDYPFGARDNCPQDGVAEPREVGTTEWDRSTTGARDMGTNVAEWTSEANGTTATVKGAEPGLRAELFFRYARRAKNSVATLLDRSSGRGFRCAEDFSLNSKGKEGDGE